MTTKLRHAARLGHSIIVLIPENGSSHREISQRRKY